MRDFKIVKSETLINTNTFTNTYILLIFCKVVNVETSKTLKQLETIYNFCS